MKTRISEIIHKYYIEILLLLFLVLLTYGYEITNWTMTIDEEVNVNISRSNVCRGWIAQGRWGISLLKLFLPTYRMLPFWNGLMSITILCIGAIWLCKITDWFKVGVLGHCAAIFAYVCMPIFSFYLMFDTYSVEISIGILLSLISGYKIIEAICITHRKKDFFIGFLCLTGSISIYQLLFQIYICVVCIGILAYIYFDEKVGIKNFVAAILKAVVSLCAALAVYAVVNTLLRTIFGQNDYYIDNFFRWGYLDWSLVIGFVKEQMKNIYFQPEHLFKGGNILYLAYGMLIISFIIMLIKGWRRGIGITICIIGVFISVGVGVIIMGGPMPLRTFQVIPIFTGIAFAIGLKLIRDALKNKIVTMILTFSIVIASLNQSARVVELFYSENNRQIRDLFLTNNIAKAIEDLGYGTVPECPVVFIGYPKTLEANLQKEELFSLSMLTLAQNRTYAWFSLQGYDYRYPTEQEREEALEIVGDKPIWPLKGSVFYWNNMIIVNLGEL